MKLDYNTQRNQLKIKEYGRWVQKMVEHTKTIENTEQKQRAANTVIELMNYFSPHLKNIEDYKQKLWDHLFVIANFDLNVESPYPKPTLEEVNKKPARLAYPKYHSKNLHLGSNVAALISNTLKMEDPELKKVFIHLIINSMKQVYSIWHQDQLEEEVLRQELLSLSNRQLNYVADEDIKKALSELKGNVQEVSTNTHTNTNGGGGFRRHKFKFKKNKSTSPNPNQNQNQQINLTKNYNNSNSSNISLAIPAKKKKFKKYKY